MLFNAGIRQNFIIDEGNLEKQKEAKKLSPKSWKHETKVYANPALR